MSLPGVNGTRILICEFWTSPDNPGELAVGQTRQLGDSSPTSWDIIPLAKSTVTLR